MILSNKLERIIKKVAKDEGVRESTVRACFEHTINSLVEEINSPTGDMWQFPGFGTWRIYPFTMYRSIMRRVHKLRRLKKAKFQYHSKTGIVKDLRKLWRLKQKLTNEKINRGLSNNVKEGISQL